MSLRKKLKEKVSDFLDFIMDDDEISSFSDQMATLSVNTPITCSVGYMPMIDQTTMYNYSVAPPCSYIVEEYMPMEGPTPYDFIVEEKYFTAMAYGPSSLINMPMAEMEARPDFQIFLSFRGEDTRHGFTGNLCHALKQNGLKVFMDDQEIEKGDSISKTIKKGIRESKLSIIVFSENFANSTWCLNEVVEILECRRKRNQLVWPVFYKVDPSDVRHQRNSYETAMTKQERKFREDPEKVKKWRSALTSVCGLNAFHYKKNSGYESNFIEHIVENANKIRHQLDG